MHQSIAAMYLERVAQSGDAIAVRYKEAKEYRDVSWRDFGAMIDEMAFGLAALGLEPASCGAVMANTSHLWVASDLAILCAGAVSVPIYPTSASSDVQHILNNSESRILFVYDEKLLDRVMKVKDNVPLLTRIVLLTEPKKGKTVEQLSAQLEAEPGLIISLAQLRELGRKLQADQPEAIKQRIANIKFDDLATIIYTSGTTGTPKGVMLLNSTILTVVDDMPTILNINSSDEYLSFLPLSHVFERVVGEFFWLANGATTAFAEGLEHLPKNMQETQPTIMLVVPRLLDKIHAKVMSGISGASLRGQKLIHWAIAVGKEVVWLKGQGQPIGPGLQAKHWVADKLVFNKLRQRIGRRLRIIISGGAPGTPEVIEFFNAIGINVIEGYGLTETAAPTNVNRVNQNKIGTVGPSLPSVQIKVAPDGEILFKGPSIFPGYFKADNVTAEAFTDGWFHTGDIGVVDSDGYLKITDRKKDLIVNSSGKNIAPQKIESAVRQVPLVSQAIVFGDKRKSLVALITLDEHAAMEFARERNWDVVEYCELIKLPQLKRYLKNEITDRCYALADYEQVRDFAILPCDLSVETGEMTATLKVKRSVVKDRYKDLIEGLYRGDGILAGAR